MAMGNAPDSGAPAKAWPPPLPPPVVTDDAVAAAAGPPAPPPPLPRSPADRGDDGDDDGDDCYDDDDDDDELVDITDLQPPPAFVRLTAHGYHAFYEKHLDAMMLALRRVREWVAAGRPSSPENVHPPRVYVRLVLPGDAHVSLCSLEPAYDDLPSVAAVMLDGKQRCFIDVVNEAAIVGSGAPPTLAWCAGQLIAATKRLQRDAPPAPAAGCGQGGARTTTGGGPDPLPKPPPSQAPPAPLRARARSRSPPPRAALIWEAVAAPLAAPLVNSSTCAALRAALADGDAATAAALVNAVQGQLQGASLLLQSARGPLARLASELQGRTDG